MPEPVTPSGSPPAPTAPSRTRPSWPQLPETVREAIEARIGERVLSWTSHEGGYSSGMASVLHTAAGPVFVKAQGPENTYTQHLYREEAHRHAVLPDTVPAPALHWLIDVPEASWVALAFDAVPGRQPSEALDGDDLTAVAELATRIAEHEIPAGTLPDMADLFDPDPWDELAGTAATDAAGVASHLATFGPWVRTHLDVLAELAAPCREALTGPYLQHNDLRADNTLILDETTSSTAPLAVAVDWPWAARGAAFADLVGMLPALHLAGGPTPEDVLDRHPLPPATDDDAVTCFLATLCGMWIERSMQPPPPGIPHLRAFQRGQAEVTIAWLRRRLGRAS